jgi:hypothetical protein
LDPDVEDVPLTAPRRVRTIGFLFLGKRFLAGANALLSRAT